MCFSANKIVREELNNLQVKIHFPQNKSEKMMVEWGEKLDDVESKGISWQVFDQSYVNEVG